MLSVPKATLYRTPTEGPTLMANDMHCFRDDHDRLRLLLRPAPWEVSA